MRMLIWTLAALSQALLASAGLVFSRETVSPSIKEDVQHCAWRFHPHRLSNVDIRKVFIFFNGYDSSFMTQIRCEEAQDAGYTCDDSDVHPSKRLAKAQVLTFELCARAKGDEQMIADILEHVPLPENTQTAHEAAHHPASVLNTLCLRHRWSKEWVRKNEDEIALRLTGRDGPVIPEQSKLIGSSIRHARYSVTVQALQVLAATTTTFTMDALAQVVRGSSLQYRQKVTEPESDTVEYKMAVSARLSRHITRYLCSTVVGFLNGPLLGQRQPVVKRIVFGIDDDLVVHGYRMNDHTRDLAEQQVNAILNTITPRDRFQAQTHWVPVVGSPYDGQQYVMEVMILRKESHNDLTPIVFAEQNDHNKIFIRLGPATYQLGRVA